MIDLAPPSFLIVTGEAARGSDVGILRLPCGFTITPGTEVMMANAPQVPLRVRRLAVVSPFADRFDVLDVCVGWQSVFADARGAQAKSAARYAATIAVVDPAIPLEEIGPVRVAITATCRDGRPALLAGARELGHPIPAHVCHPGQHVRVVMRLREDAPPSELEVVVLGDLVDA